MSTARRLLTLGLSSLALPALSAQAALYVTVVQGLGGEPVYEQKFTEQRERLTQASQDMTDADKLAVFHGPEATREALLAHFEDLSSRMSEEDRAVIYLLGHGSFDDEFHKFNIPGPDLSTEDLKQALDALPGSKHLLVSTSSTSGALLDPLEDASRVLMTATRSGAERNATEFGTFFAEALVSPEADINKNNSISAQEAFDYANSKVSDFYQSAGKLATEHPQLRGADAGTLVLARLQSSEDLDLSGADPEIQVLIDRRNEIEREIEELQLRRGELPAAEYTARLRELILESATVTERIQNLGSQPAEPAAGDAY